MLATMQKMFPFAELVELQSDAGRKLKQKEYLTEGILPVVDQGAALIGGYTNDESLQYTGPLPVVVFGDHTRNFKLIDFPFAVGADGVKLLAPKDGVDASYLYYMLLAVELPNRGYSRHLQFLKKTELPLPPLPQQRRIVQAIELQLGRLDAAVARLQGAKARLKRYKQAVLKAALEDIDGNWTRTTLGDVAKWGSGATPKRSTTAYFGGNIPWLKTGELGPKYVTSTEEYITPKALAETAVKVHPKGSVAIAMYGATIGKTSILGIDATSNQACAVGQPIRDLISSDFLYYFLLAQREALVGMGVGGAQPNISQGMIKEYPIALPNAKEQKQIVTMLEEKLGTIDETEATLDAQLQQAVRLRQAVLKRAFEGRLG